MLLYPLSATTRESGARHASSKEFVKRGDIGDTCRGDVTAYDKPSLVSTAIWAFFPFFT
ncbi:MAG TPA: hypothetical protein PKM17_13670 [Syntrophorhabdus sp.]|nr:hypothetical protein [Syntrophorhabdus sp.]